MLKRGMRILLGEHSDRSPSAFGLVVLVKDAQTGYDGYQGYEGEVLYNPNGWHSEYVIGRFLSGIDVVLGDENQDYTALLRRDRTELPTGMEG